MTPRPNSRHGVAAALLVLVVAACGGGATAAPTSATGASIDAPAAPSALPLEVGVDEAASLRDAGAFVLDVREPDEWAAGHIPDATLIPLGELASRVAEVPQGLSIVVVCRSGNRSAQARDLLIGAGFTSVTSLAGGMNDWTATGLPVTTGS